MTEAELIAAARRGNTDAFGELYKLHLDTIYGYVRRRVSETVEAENLTQTVFLKAWQALDRYQPATVPFRAWLYRIAHNTVIDHYRTRKEVAPIEEHTDLPTGDASPEETVLSQERSEFLKKGLANLKPAYQQVLALRFLSGLDYAETAAVLGRQVNAVRVLQFRALEALHKVLAQGSGT
jgi:RNA polymerase sigma-70 factor (ECF subfamily)